MNFRQQIAPAIHAELQQASQQRSAGNAKGEFHHLERAHVLGQASTYWHVVVHIKMLGWGWRQRQTREVLGQLLRIVGAATKTVFGWVPAGNTGGANVSPFKPMPIAADLAAIISAARQPTTNASKK